MSLNTETDYAADQYAKMVTSETPFLSELEKHPFLRCATEAVFRQLHQQVIMKAEISEFFFGMRMASTEFEDEPLADEFRFLSALVRKVEQ